MSEIKETTESTEMKKIVAPNGMTVSEDANAEYYKDFDLTQMESAEQKIIAEIDATENEIKEHTYDLKRTKEYPRQKVGQDIAEFLSRKECTWEYTKGMFDLIEFWKGSSLKLPYSYFDSTVRILGQLQYKGEDFGKVVSINEYFQDVRPFYRADIERMVELSMRHNAVIQAMENYKKMHNIIDAVEK